MQKIIIQPDIRFKKYFNMKFLLAFFCTAFTLHNLYAQNDNKAFGDSIFVSDGLLGKIYLLPQNTPMLPNFDTLQPIDTIYTQSINIPPRSWSAGFPGLPNRFEWFAIEYTGTFKTNKPGHYIFKLLSDDGSKLFIDDKLIIDNDKLHGVAVRTGEVDLNNSHHSIKIQYFQGPRYQIALQLFAALQNSKEEIFPGNNFVLSTPDTQSSMSWLYATVAGIVLVIITILRKQRGKNKA
jgi:hypothetical protein